MKKPDQMRQKYVLLMSKMVFISILVTTNVYADNRMIDTRCCVEILRTSSGKIKRSVAVIREFERLYPLPPGYKRDDWQIDHVIPLSVGGVDAVRNMQWLPKTIKTCSSDDCKDRFERIIYKQLHNTD